MPNRKVKCPVCEKTLTRGEAIRREENKRYYHPECLKEVDRTAGHYQELISTVCRIYRMGKPTGQILQQLKNYKEQFGYTDKGMELTLKYYYGTLGNRPREGDGVGIIPHYYHKAKLHFIKMRGIAQSAKEYEEPNVIELEIDPKTNKRKSSMIDIEEL